MLVKNLSCDSVPPVKLSDTVYHVLSLMSEYNITHLAVVHEEKFAGIISENVLLEADEELTIGQLEHSFLQFSVKDEDHFLKAVSLAVSQHLTIVPVIDSEGNLCGNIESNHLLKYVSDFIRVQDPAGLIVLEIEQYQYSFSEISKIVETNDAQITQLNTSRDNENETTRITLRINKLDISDVVATFQRYEYNVIYYSGDETYTNELKSNYENLMNYLNI